LQLGEVRSNAEALQSSSPENYRILGLNRGFGTKRAILKSLVRENRTQGSVRGLPGNRQFYLDGKKKLKIN
ncbi:group II intron reverse transcriptase/maturase, partial [candidate division CSSED10-310 bacterium]